MEYSEQGANSQFTLGADDSTVGKKLATVRKAKEDKLAKFAPPPPQTYQEAEAALYGVDGGNSSSSYIDQAQAGFNKLGRDISTLGTDVGQYVAEGVGAQGVADWMGSVEHRTDEQINKEVGFDPTVRDAAYDKIGVAYDEGRYGDMALSTIKAVPEILTDSLPYIATLPLGGAGAFAKAATVANTAAKASRAASIATKSQALKNIAAIRTIPEGLSVAQKAKEGLSVAASARKAIAVEEQIATQLLKKSKFLNKVDSLVKINRSTVGLGLVTTNTQLNERKKNNDGESSSLMTAVASFGANTVLFGIEFGIVKNIFKSGAKEIAADLTVNTADAIASGSIKALAKAVAKNIINISEIAGAEAAQEYLQQWTQILTEQAGTKDKGGFLDVINDPKNIKDTAIAAIMGAGAGGATRAVPSAIGLPIKAIATVGGKGSRKAGEYLGKRAKEASYKALTQADRDTIQAKYDKEDKVVEEITTGNKGKIDKITAATTLEELQALDDNRVTEVINMFNDKNTGAETLVKQVKTADTIDNLKKVSYTIGGAVSSILSKHKSLQEASEAAIPDLTLQEIKIGVLEVTRANRKPINLEDKLDTIKNEAIAQYNKANLTLKTKHEANRVADVGYAVAKNTKQAVKRGIKAVTDQITPETRKAIIQATLKGIDITKAAVEDTITGIKDLDKSTARAMLSDVSKGKLNKALFDFSSSELDSLKTSFKNNPKAIRRIEWVQKKKRAALKDYAIYKKEADASGKTTLDKIVDVAGKVLTSNNANKIRGFVEAKVDDFKDSEFLKKAKVLLKDLEGKLEELTEEEKSVVKDTREKVDKAEIAIEAEAKNPTLETELVSEGSFINYKTVSEEEFKKLLRSKLVDPDKIIDLKGNKNISTDLITALEVALTKDKASFIAMFSANIESSKTDIDKEMDAHKDTKADISDTNDIIANNKFVNEC